MVRRSTLLAVLLSVLLAGCTGTGTIQTTPTAGPPSDSPVTTTTPTDGAPATTRGYYRAYDFRAVTTSEGSVVRSVTLDRSDVESRVTWRTQPFVSDLFETGTATRVAIGPGDGGVPGPFDEGTLVRRDGRVYRIEKAVVERHAGPSYQMHLEGPIRSDYRGEYSVAGQEVTNFSALSAADRRLVSYSIPAPDERADAVHSTGFTWVFPANATAEDSRLVDGGTHYVRQGGDVFVVEGEREPNDAVRYRVRYDLVAVSSTEGFTADSLDTYVTPLNESTVDAPARGVITETIDRGTLEWSGRTATPERIRAAATWIQEHSPDHSVAFVRYEGDLYRLEFVHAVE